MDLEGYNLKTLFDQLGLPSEETDIDDFIDGHSLDADTKLVDAPFWSEPQKQTLQEWIGKDDDRAIVFDELNVRLHDGK
ncbi:DUF2789 family protein [Pseudomonas sp. N40(2020)]|uniref:DUF2789 family protein n=1 Tax=Pseudomonas sp. N40(2020) TaxID=2767798 RepID=UPI001656A80D|nr:DUF2789 family protein [Pseudomonas sp. N40(2020)]MBC9000220.1 DUF2789 family protein [Pseudomonas sp. N40(2020)]